MTSEGSCPTGRNLSGWCEARCIRDGEGHCEAVTEVDRERRRHTWAQWFIQRSHISIQ